MPDGITRWSQIVRSPGSFQIHGSHPTIVPPLDGSPLAAEARAGVRLLGHPVEMADPSYMIDMTTTAGLAMLEGFVATGNHLNRVISWQSRGWGVRRRDTIRLSRRT
jgi:hypothetical protein